MAPLSALCKEGGSLTAHQAEQEGGGKDDIEADPDVGQKLKK